MAGRGNKVSLDYFELDCHMDEKVRLLQAEYGLKGFAVFVKLLQEIYGENGYYCEWTRDRELLFASETGLNNGSIQLLRDIVSACIRRNIFSEKLFKKYGILTSSGVQKQYLKATVKREAVELKKEYLLINVPKNRSNVVINSISDGRNSISDGINKQSKEEKSKEEKSKEYHGQFVPPSVEEVREYCKERNNNIDPQEFVDFYSSKGWMIGKNKMKDWKACIRTWEKSRENKSVNFQNHAVPGSFNDFQQRDYDFNELEKMLLENSQN